ncbi:MAG: S41 family peptidase [Acidobacteriota bacterium]|nr:S41 family peptidase [Acidobacteriota bacterium]
MTTRWAALALCVWAALPAAALAQTSRPPAAAPPVLTLDRAATPAFRETSGTLFENVVAILQQRYVDETFRKQELPKIVARYAERAKESRTLREQRQVVHDLLSNIPASHLGLLSKATHRALMADLLRVAYPNFGFQLVGAGQDYYAGFVLEGGPALRSGLLTGDRIVTIDGVPVAQSPRLDWRSDDAYLTDVRDPAIHQVLAAAGERISLGVERRLGEFVTVQIAAEEYSAFDAARASARTIREGGRTFGYLHFWFVHMAGVPELLREKIDGEFKDADGLILDLRGRGGSAPEVTRIVALVKSYLETTKKPVVALVDRQSRSGKDILAYEFKAIGVRLVGEASAGAVIPAMFADVGHDSVLMFPTFRLPGYTDKLEFKPVEPHVTVERAGMFAAGRDAILEASVREILRLKI